MPESSNLPPPTTDTEIDHYFSEYLMHSKLEKNEDYRYSTWIVGGEYEIPYFECKAVNPQMWGYDPMKLTVHAPNQIEWVIDHFKTHGHGNEHCYITVGYPESNKAYDVPFTNEQERKTSPCLRGLDFRIIDGELTTSVYYRSWDLWSGWPCNMGGFVLLNEYVADSVGVYPGPLSFSCKSLHAYSFHMDVMDSRLGKSKWSKVL
jgi:thymidylate synthase